MVKQKHSRRTVKVISFRYQVVLVVSFLFGIVLVGLLQNGTNLEGLSNFKHVDFSEFFPKQGSDLSDSSRVDDPSTKPSTKIDTKIASIYPDVQGPPNFQLEATELLPIVDSAIHSHKNELTRIATTRNASFNEVRNLALADASLDHLRVIGFLAQVSPSKEVRDAAHQADQVLAEYSVVVGLRSDVYEVVKSVVENHPVLEKLEQRLLDQTLRDYVRAGLALPADVQEKVKVCQQKIVTVASTYMQNLAEDDAGLWLFATELEGVPEELYQSWDNRSAGFGVPQYHMKFRQTDVGPVVRLANSEQTRRNAWIGDNVKLRQNAELVVEMIKLRTEFAALKGYDYFADYALEDKMAKNVSTVETFLSDLREKVTGLGHEELATLQEVKTKHGASGSLNEWDRGWALSILLKENYNYDTDTIAEYFEMDNTIREMLTVFETLFDLDVQQTPIDDSQHSIWHGDVRQFSVHRKNSNEFLGWLYMDLFPREGKFGHAANMALRTSYVTADGQKIPTITALVCNFSKPTKSKPSLLKHGEVRTLFHELGHGIHSLMSDTPWYRFNSQGAVELDFSEAPSQMLENWCYSSKVLKQISRHYQTGKPLTDAQISSLQEVRHVGSAIATLRSIAFAMFDMKIHTDYKGTTAAELTALWNEIMTDVALQMTDKRHVQGFNSFMHIIDGYEAGYYSYLYSEVFSADMYSTKFAKHEFDPKVGTRYGDIVLAPGGSKDAIEYLTEFLGRPPNNRAFLKDIGVS